MATSAHHYVRAPCPATMSGRYVWQRVWTCRLHTSNVDLVCSARGCRAEARWSLRWNNPKLHPPERRKTWLACDEHLDQLSDFLRARGFLRETEPV